MSSSPFKGLCFLSASYCILHALKGSQVTRITMSLGRIILLWNVGGTMEIIGLFGWILPLSITLLHLMSLALVVDLAGLLLLRIGDVVLDLPDLALLYIVVLGIHPLIVMIRNDLLVIHRLFCVTWSFLEHNGLISLQMSYNTFDDVPTAPLYPIIKKRNFSNVGEAEIERIIEEDKEESRKNVEKWIREQNRRRFGFDFIDELINRNQDFASYREIIWPANVSHVTFHRYWFGTLGETAFKVSPSSTPQAIAHFLNLPIPTASYEDPTLATVPAFPISSHSQAFSIEMVHPLYASGGYGGNVPSLRNWLDHLEQHFRTLWKQGSLPKPACMVRSFNRKLDSLGRNIRHAELLDDQSKVLSQPVSILWWPSTYDRCVDFQQAIDKDLGEEDAQNAVRRYYHFSVPFLEIPDEIRSAFLSSSLVGKRTLHRIWEAEKKAKRILHSGGTVPC